MLITKRTSRILAILGVIWLPLSLLINPGWGTLIVLSLFGIFFFTPLLVMWFSPKVPTVLSSRLQLAFYIAWFCIGLFFVNGGDTAESIGSIFSNLLGGSTQLDDFSAWVSQVALWSSILLAIAIIYRGLRDRKKSPPRPAA